MTTTILESDFRPPSPEVVFARLERDPIVGTELFWDNLTYVERDELCEIQERANSNLVAIRSGLIMNLNGDWYTREHSDRVGLTAAAIGLRMGWDRDVLVNLAIAAKAHDIAKEGSLELVYTDAAYTPEQRSSFSQHAEIGGLIVRSWQDDKLGIRNAKLVGLHHSYKREVKLSEGLVIDLREFKIRPFLRPTVQNRAQVLSTADAFDALGSDRPYRDAVPPGRLMGLLIQELDATQPAIKTSIEILADLCRTPRRIKLPSAAYN